jgi:hypothetical protein
VKSCEKPIDISEEDYCRITGATKAPMRSLLSGTLREEAEFVKDYLEKKAESEKCKIYKRGAYSAEAGFNTLDKALIHHPFRPLDSVTATRDTELLRAGRIYTVKHIYKWSDTYGWQVTLHEDIDPHITPILRADLFILA